MTVCKKTPIWFNIYIKKNLIVNDCPLSDKADECVVIFTSEVGLHMSIDRTVGHFAELGLKVNTKKKKLWFSMKMALYKQPGNGEEEKTDKYTYLVLVFNPSDFFTSAANELLTGPNFQWAMYFMKKKNQESVP